MKKDNYAFSPATQRTAIALAVSLAVSGGVFAEEDDEVARLIKPDSSVSLGLGNINKDNQRFGVYNGMHKSGVVPLVDFSIIRRDDAEGTWFRAYGRNLGLHNREFGLDYERQGQWRAYYDFSELTRTAPYRVFTGVTNNGDASVTVPAPASRNQEFIPQTERLRSTVGFKANLVPTLAISAQFVNEEKTGSRLFGRGGPAQEFLAEPINSTTRQFDLILDYTGDDLQLSGGYYGSFYNNTNSVLRVVGGAAGFNAGVGSTGVAFDNVSLPPDNYAHQLNLAGAYRISKTTTMNFTLARSLAIQNDEFIGVRFFNAANNGVNANTSGRTSLGGELDTMVGTLGISSRPIKDLTIIGTLRYEDRRDNTDVARYITAVGGTGAAPVINPLAGTSTTDGFNEPRSLTTITGKLEATYALYKGYRVTAGVDLEEKERTMSGVRVVGYRETTAENTYRLELKRLMSESVNGSVAYLHSVRDGSDYRNLVTLNGINSYPNYGAITATRGGLLQPIYMADRERDKLRLLMDWSPTDALSTQFVVEASHDNYGAGRGSPDIGVREGNSRLYSLDLSYSLNDAWRATGWLSRIEASIDQATFSGNTNAASLLWSSTQKNVVNSLGVGVRGKLTRGVEIGADLIYAGDVTRYGQSKESYAPFVSAAGVTSLPDIKYHQNSLRLFGTYPFDKKTKLRLDYVYDNRRIDDWTWTGYTYSDGTQIIQNPKDTVQFIGVSVIYSFQ